MQCAHTFNIAMFRTESDKRVIIQPTLSAAMADHQFIRRTMVVLFRITVYAVFHFFRCFYVMDLCVMTAYDE